MLNKDFSVTVRKLTDRDLMLSACESTFLGKSNQSLLSIYKSEHSPARTQLFWIEMKNIKLYIASHFVRHHVGIEKFMLTMRDDRHGGKDQCPYIAERLSEILAIPEEYRDDSEVKEMYFLLDELKNNAGRNARTNLSVLVNAQSLIDLAKLRLCTMAAKETRSVFKEIKKEIKKVDSELAKMMVPKCVYRGGICGEPNCCGYNVTSRFNIELDQYLSSFNKQQAGIHATR